MPIGYCFTFLLLHFYFLLFTLILVIGNLSLKPFPREFWLVTLSSLIYFFAIQMTFPIVPLFITDGLGASEAIIGTSVLVVALIESPLRLPAGTWSDRHGRRRYMTIGALMGILYPAIMLVSSTIEIFMVSRMAHGISLAVFLTAMKAYVADIVPAERRGEAYGINTSAFAVALILGPLAGEAVMNEYGFDTAFAIMAILALVSFVTVLFLPDETHHVPTRQSMLGSAKRVLATRGAWASLAVAASGSTVFVAFFVFFPIYAEEINLAAKAPAALENISISLGYSLFAVMNLIIMPRVGRFSDQHGRTAAILPGMVLMILGIAALALARNYVLVYIAIAIVSSGFSFVRSVMDAIMQDACPQELRGTGTAVLFTIWALIIGFGSQGFGIIIEESGFNAMYAFSAVVIIIFAALGFWLSRNTETERRTRTRRLNLPVSPR